MRSEPPPSLPCATGSMPPATAAAAPPEEPPGVRSVSHGLRVGPVWRGSVVGRIPNSGMLVMPTITNPASCNRRTRYALWPGRWSPRNFDPKFIGSPATGVLALIAIGTPANGRSSPGSMGSAAASAPSASTSTNALSLGSRSSIRSSVAVTTSRARSSPPRTWAASSPTLMAMRSLIRGRQPRSPGRTVKIPRSRSSNLSRVTG